MINPNKEYYFITMISLSRFINLEREADMKKILISITLLICMVACIANAEVDYLSMDAKKLSELIAHASNALLQKEPVEDENVFYDRDGIKIYYESIEIMEKEDRIRFNLIMINDTDKKVEIDFREPTVNGWEITRGFSNNSVAEKAKSRKGYIELGKICSLSGIKSFEEIESIDTKICVRNGTKDYLVRCIMTYDDGNVRLITREYLD